MGYQYDIPFHIDLTGRVALVTGGNGGIGGGSAARWLPAARRSSCSAATLKPARRSWMRSRKAAATLGPSLRT